MKTTIDLPDALLEWTIIAAARRHTTIENLIIEGLLTVLGEETAAITRLRQGYHLGGQPFTRDQVHDHGGIRAVDPFRKGGSPSSPIG